MVSENESLGTSGNDVWKADLTGISTQNLNVVEKSISHYFHFEIMQTSRSKRFRWLYDKSEPINKKCNGIRLLMTISKLA